VQKLPKPWFVFWKNNRIKYFKILVHTVVNKNTTDFWNTSCRSLEIGKKNYPEESVVSFFKGEVSK
jgi:hypothetical protein